jgi:hypothetical protein
VRGLGLTACLAALALATAPAAAAQEEERPPPPVVPVADDALADALESGELTEAEYALERARSVFQLARVRREFGDVARPAARDATLILRDLAVRLRGLTGAERAAAGRILARPDDGDVPEGVGPGWEDLPEADASPTCGDVCVHWVDHPLSDDAPPALDVDPANGIPDWVDLTLLTLDEVWLEEIGVLGYRAPLSDVASPNNGGNMLLDVYLDDLGAKGVFGYCTTDDPRADDHGVYAVSAYCVIDNDFADFGGATWDEFRKFLGVTSAHEFHHASQFAYDWLEDYWLMEGTATNIEETVYPEINDNVFYLRLFSPLSRPSSPLDRGGFGNSEYGSWIFWRFLEEKIAAGDPGILREIWERADASSLAAFGDQYSLQAVRTALTERGHVFADIFAQFGRANRLLDYADAGTAGYPAVPLTEKWRLGRNKPTTGRRSWTINHLAARYFSFVPGSSATLDGDLAVRLELPRHGARATVIVVEADGSTVTRYLRPNEDGFARKVVRFGRGEVRRVDLVLLNGSTRTACWRDRVFPPFFSCFGRPRDDGRAFELRARFLP